MTEPYPAYFDFFVVPAELPEPDYVQPTAFQEIVVPNPLLDALAAQVTANTNAEASATLLINGIAARIAAAVAAAIAGGATAAQLAPVQAEIDAMRASATALAAAVLANTPVVHVGRIVSIAGLSITMSHTDGSPNDAHTVAATATITLNGTTALLTALLPGDGVTLTGSPATSVVATR